MGLGGVAIATLPSVIFPKLMFSVRLGGKSLHGITKICKFATFKHQTVEYMLLNNNFCL